jgi:hypothetical protein
MPQTREELLTEISVLADVAVKLQRLGIATTQSVVEVVLGRITSDVGALDSL